MRNLSLVERVCESFYAKSIDSALKSVSSIRHIGELRFDLSELTLEDISQIQKASERKLIFTCRTNKVLPFSALEAYKEAILSGFNYIDIDFFEDRYLLDKLLQLIQNHPTRLILSYHNYQLTPTELELKKTLKELGSSEADIIKISTLVQSKDDIETLVRCQKNTPNSVIMGMGEWAVESRIRCLRAGALFTYLALHLNQTTAKGQADFIGFQKSFNEFRGGEKLKLAVLGNPITHSKSPDLFHGFFKQDGIKGVYEKIELEDIEEIEILKKQFDGFNVTAPFKQSIIPYLDELSEAAQKIGAVNTVYQKDDKWVGDNTDFIGILKAIESAKNPSEIRNCLILGAGGAARAAAFAMQKAQISTTILNRTYSKALALSDEFSVQSVQEINIYDFQLIINTIPEPFSLVNETELNKHHIVLDAVYPSSFFEEPSSKIGFTFIPGELWLVGQAEESYRIFSDVKF